MLRIEQSLLQRQLTTVLEIDTPMYSKIECGDRCTKREQVIKLAECLYQDEKKCSPCGGQTSLLMLLRMSRSVNYATMLFFCTGDN